jgi:hypothetical protein
LKKHGRILEIQQSPWLISKNYFAGFYFLGITIAPLVLVYEQEPIVYLFFSVHLSRRFYETIVLFHSTTKMHMIHALVGFSFYPIVWYIIFRSEIIFSLISCGGFLISCWGQYLSHKILSKNKDKKRLPNHWAFRIFICPNYTMEVLIYFFLHLSLYNWNSFLLLLFVFLNQAISAIDKKLYYQNTTDLNAWAIFPYL